MKAGQRGAGLFHVIKMLREITGKLMQERGHWLLAVVFFVLAAIVQTWPLVLHASDKIIDVPDQPGDTGQYLWNLWWVKHALLEKQTNPFHTDAVLFPQGADLYLGGVIIVSSIMSIPLQLVTGNLVLSANLLNLALFVFSGLSMYALSLHVTHNRLAALASGFIFAFTPWTVSHFQGGEWNHSATWPLPLFALFVLRFQETLRLREAVAAGVCWAVIIYNWLEYGVDIALFVGLFASYWSVVILRRRDWRRLLGLWRGFAVLGAVAFVLASPLIIVTLRELYSGRYELPPADEFYSGDLQSYIKPSALWGPGKLPGSPYGTHLPVGSIEGTSYLGMAPLALAGLAILSVRRTPHRVVFWAIVFVVFATLALGPYLYVGGSKTASLFGHSFSVSMPYQIYDRLPVVGSRRFTARMIIFGILALAVLAGVGLDVLTSWLTKQAKRLVVQGVVAVATFSVVVCAAYIAAHEYHAGDDSPVIIAVASGSIALIAIGLAVLLPLLWPSGSLNARYQPLALLVACLVFLVVIFEYWNPPVQLSHMHRPAIFERIRDEPGNFVVLDAPLGRQDGYFVSGDSSGGYLATYYQWMYEKPTVGGYVPRGVDIGWVMDQPGFHYLACRCTEFPVRRYRTPDVRAILRNYRIKYIVLHKRGPHGQGLLFVGEGDVAIYEAYLHEVLNFAPIYSDPSVTVYRNRDPELRLD